MLPHTTYSPDLEPSDYFLSLNMKKWFSRKGIGSNDEIIAQKRYFSGPLEILLFGKGPKIGEGDFVDKQIFFCQKTCFIEKVTNKWIILPIRNYLISRRVEPHEPRLSV